MNKPLALAALLLSQTLSHATYPEPTVTYAD